MTEHHRDLQIARNITSPLNFVSFGGKRMHDQDLFEAGCG